MSEENKKSRESIIDRVRKMARMTVANGASESEANMASSRMAALIAEYDIQQSELTIRADANGCIFDEYIDTSPNKTPWTASLPGLAKLYGVRYYYQPRHEDVFDLGFTVPVVAVKVFGFQTDVAAFIGMCMIIHGAIANEGDIFERTLRKSKKQHHRRADFELGMAHRIKERLKAMHEEKIKESSRRAGSALIVLKDQLVTEQWTEQLKGLNLRPGTSIRVRDIAAFAAGHVKGGAVELNKRVR